MCCGVSSVSKTRSLAAGGLIGDNLTAFFAKCLKHSSTNESQVLEYEKHLELLCGKFLSHTDCGVYVGLAVMYSLNHIRKSL